MSSKRTTIRKAQMTSAKSKGVPRSEGESGGPITRISHGRGISEQAHHQGTLMNYFRMTDSLDSVPDRCYLGEPVEAAKPDHDLRFLSLLWPRAPRDLTISPRVRFK